MPVKIMRLTAPQRGIIESVVQAKTTDFVVSTGPTFAVLNGNAEQAAATVQSVLDEIRGTSGARPLETVLRKLREGNPEHVTNVAKGSNVTGDIPPVLAGAAVADAQETLPPPRRRGRPPKASTPVVTKVADPMPVRSSTGHVESLFADEGSRFGAQPSVTPNTAKARENFRDLANSARSENGRRYWMRKAEEVSVT